MPDVLRGLGVKKIHRLVSMSNDKYDAIVRAGSAGAARVRIPDTLLPVDAHVEMGAERTGEPRPAASCSSIWARWC